MTNYQKSPAQLAWDKYKDSHDPKGPHEFYYADNAAYFQEGYNVGHKDALEEVDMIFKNSLLAVKEIILHCDQAAQKSAVNMIDQCLFRFNTLKQETK